MKPVYALVPIKPFARAKRRLAAAVSPAQRAALARAMARRALLAAGRARGVDRVYALCADRAGRALARRCGATPLAESGRASLSRLLADSFDRLHAGGAGTVLYVASDLPDVTSTDIEWLLARHRGGLTVVAAARDGGTNAMLCDLPRPLGLSFGPASAARHLSRARRSGLPATRLAGGALSADLDTLADLDRRARRAARA